MNHDPSNWEHAVKWSAASLYGGMLYTSVALVQPLTFMRYSEHRIGEGLGMSATTSSTDVATVVCDTVNVLPGNGNEPGRAEKGPS